MEQSSLIIVVADHGESLDEHGYHFQHGHFLFDVMLKVPFMLHLPYHGPSGVVIEEIVRTVDIVPTICHLLGIEPKVKTHGTSLLPLVFGKSDSVVSQAYGETLLPIRDGQSELRAIKTKRHKLVFAPATNGYLLFDLQDDPSEINNLLLTARGNKKIYYEKYRPVLLELTTKLEHVIKSTRSDIPLRPETPDEETVRKLKSLGYM